MILKANHLTLTIAAIIAVSSSGHALAAGDTATGGSSADLTIEVERAGGMDSAGKDPKDPDAAATSGLEALNLNAAPDYTGQLDALEGRSGVVQTRLSSVRADIATGKISADALQARAAAALIDAQTMKVAAEGALVTAQVANSDAIAAKTAASTANTTATSALDSANTAALYASWLVNHNSALATQNATTATALSNASGVITDAQGYIVTQESNTTAEEQLTQTVIAETNVAIAQANAAEAAALTASTQAGLAKTNADAAYARSVDAMQLAKEALAYVPKHASGVSRKSGGTKQVVDSEYTTLGNMAYVATGGSGASGLAVSSDASANAKSSVTFIASVFKSNYTVNNMVWSGSSGKNARLLVNSVEIGSAAVPTTAGGTLSFANVSIGYGDTVTIEYDAGVGGGNVTSDAVILCDTAAGATCTRS